MDRLNLFVDATKEVLSTMANINVETVNELSSENLSTTWGDVTGLVSLPGSSVSGVMSISFESQCILSIVEKLIEEKHSEINKVVSDAAGELTNMVSSVARTKLTELGIELGMALPFTVVGKGVEVDNAVSGETRAMKLNTSYGDMVLTVVLSD